MPSEIEKKNTGEMKSQYDISGISLSYWVTPKCTRAPAEFCSKGDKPKKMPQ